jgi:hypothetical protein
VKGKDRLWTTQTTSIPKATPNNCTNMLTPATPSQINRRLQ